MTKNHIDEIYQYCVNKNELDCVVVAIQDIGTTPNEHICKDITDKVIDFDDVTRKCKGETQPPSSCDILFFVYNNEQKYEIVFIEACAQEISGKRAKDKLKQKKEDSKKTMEAIIQDVKNKTRIYPRLDVDNDIKCYLLFTKAQSFLKRKANPEQIEKYKELGYDGFYICSSLKQLLAKKYLP